MINFTKILKQYEERGILTKETLLEGLQKECIRHPNKIAAIDEQRWITYKELEEEIGRFADGLMRYGVCKGDKVLLHMPNGIAYVMVLFALMKVGAMPALLLQEHRESEIVSIGKTIEASVLITAYNDLILDWGNMIERAVSQLPSLKIVVSDFQSLSTVINTACVTFEHLKSEKIMEANNCKYNETAIFLLSGGTTGIPKIIPKVQEAYLYNARAAAKRCRFNEKTVYLAVLSVSHDLALANPGILGTLLSGGTIVLPKTAAFDDAFEMIEKYKVTVTCLVPALALVWVNALDFYDNDLSSLEQILIGASKLDKNLGKQLISKFGVKLQQGYGLGEGVTCFTTLDDEENSIIETQGTPISQYDEVKIVNSECQEVMQGEEGELIEKGPYTFGGYYNNDALNRQSFTQDGFFKTGDKAKKDEKGNIIILGRVREQINRAGENVNPAEVETYLRKCPGVENACVFGMPDEKLGEKTVACIQSALCVNKKDICISLGKMGVSIFKFPDTVIQVKAFPYKNIGKVDKEKLRRDILLEGRNET